MPVETWLSKGSYLWEAPDGKKIGVATIDPNHVLPDDDRGNNKKVE